MWSKFSCWVLKVPTQLVKQQSRNNLNMSRLAVRAVAGEERMQMSFKHRYGGGVGQPGQKPVAEKEREFNLFRLQTEELGTTLARLSANVSKVVNRKKKRKKSPEDSGAEEEPNEIDVRLYQNDNEIDNTVSNWEAWSEGAVLHVGDCKYHVHVNPPTVTSLVLPHSIMAGFPVYPKLDAEFVDLNKCRFTWYKTAANLDEEKGDITETNVQAGTSSPTRKGAVSNPVQGSWVEVGSGHCYMPSNADINCRLRLVCVPANGTMTGEEIEATSPGQVDAGPGFCPFENRHLSTQKLANNHSFRLVTYNLLADVYADSDFSREHLYPYCPPYALAADYRKQLIVKELLGYKADIICLQECDRKLFQNELVSVLEAEGLIGLMKCKLGQTPEGTAIFYNKEKFRLLGQHDIGLSDYLQSNTDDDLLADIQNKLADMPVVKEKMLLLGTILQVAALESRVVPNKRIVVATTHLYFHPRANNIRLLQTEVCLRHIRQVMALYEVEDRMPALVLCGDLNSSPSSSVVQLLTTNSVPADHVDWNSHDREEEEQHEGLDLHNPLKLTSACGFPEFTNYVGGFQGCLDYIFIDKEQLKTTQVVPLPTLEEVTQCTALPNPVFPSDHLALICDVTWTDVEQQEH